MIKLIRCPKITKRELMTALMEGRRFTFEPEYIHLQQNIIHWDDNHGNSPVRAGTEPWIWRGFKYLHEITESHWYDEASNENPILCKIHSDSDDRGIDYITGYRESSLYPYQGVYDAYSAAQPILPSECYQEPV